MPATHTYDYAVIRIVPDQQRGEFINAGVVLYCRTLKFLQARVLLDVPRLLALAPDADVDDIRAHLEVIPRLCAGDATAGPIAKLTQSERFNWLVAPRSAVIQTSQVHSGLTAEPGTILERLLQSFTGRAG